MSQISQLIDELSEKHYPFVFLGGVHGVGKTFFCERIFSKAGFRCVTASSLIRAYGIRSDQNKKVQDIKDNQIALLQQLSVEKRSSEKLLLDGHYSLINNQKDVEPIDIEVFRQISPSMLVLLKDIPQTIASRLNRRDRKNWSPNFIANFQSLEEKHAHFLSEEMGIPLRVIEARS